tara:strand:- start:1430 stop:1627 length:198 start_codon:yes stop_codon:yes gene_type:complete
MDVIKELEEASADLRKDAEAGVTSMAEVLDIVDILVGMVTALTEASASLKEAVEELTPLYNEAVH